MIWRRAGVRVERVGRALWAEGPSGRGVLVDAPPGTATALGERLARLDSVLLTCGRLERVSGLVSVLGALPPARADDAALAVRFPLSDERGALLVEAWQRAWPDREVTLDGVGAGEPVEIADGEIRLVTLVDPAGPPPLGARLVFAGAEVAVLPRCRLDGAARRITRGVDLVVAEAGGSLSTAELIELAGDAELWVEAEADA